MDLAMARAVYETEVQFLEEYYRNSVKYPSR
jgi:hypothetical protein